MDNCQVPVCAVGRCLDEYSGGSRVDEQQEITGSAAVTVHAGANLFFQAATAGAPAESAALDNTFVPGRLDDIRPGSTRVGGSRLATVMETETDASLVRRAQRGDSDAFGALVERYMRRAYLQALGLVGSREDALDLSQEAFARAFRARATLDPERPFYAWLYQILRRLCFNFRRDRRTRAARLEAGGVQWLAAAAERAAPADPASALERAELRGRVAAAIERLPDREREVLVLKEFEDLKYREIAELVGVPAGTVMSRLYSARRRLAHALVNHT